LPETATPRAAAHNLDGLFMLHDGKAIAPVVAEIYKNSKNERGTPPPIFIFNAAIDSSGDKYTVSINGPDDVATGKAAADPLTGKIGMACVVERQADAAC
jgi:hypothetical protein